MTDLPPNGSIIRYPYLWTWQRDKGETEGRKSRPACLVLSIPKGIHTHLVILAISGTPPRRDQTAIEIPPLGCRRAGIRDWKQAWIIVSEFNHDIAETSFYYDPAGDILGTFSRGYLATIASALKSFLVAPNARVTRTE